MTDDTLLGNATLVRAADCVRGWIRFADGQIAEMGEGAAMPPGGLDCSGDLVAPGLVELHTDNLERHIRPRPRVDWPHEPAILAHDAELAGTGITTVFDALRVGSVVSDNRKGYLPYARPLATEILGLRDRGALRISHHLHLRAEICSETLVEELAAFGPDDRVGLVSLMDHTPGQRQFRDITKFEDYIRGKYGLSEEAFAEHCAHLSGLQTTLGAKHEAAAVASARGWGAALASHDDTTAEQVAHSAELDVRVAEFPTTLDAATSCRAAGMAIVMGAPNLVRGGSHSGNVAAEALAQDDLLDILSSDYIPAALLLGAVRLGRLWDNMARGFATVTRAPARAVGLTDRGKLEVGLRADVVRVALAGDVPVVRGVWSQGRRVA
ncbi:MAG: alpha-D-ribose 1-methylphosphonate 5-triphosphate diphosphatase [Pseudomonadota bacterium]